VKLELEAIRNLRNKENLRNVWLAVPYIRTYRELREMKHLISDAGFKRSSTFKIFMVVEVPSSVIRIEKLLDIGIDGVIVDLDTLSQLILGIDKVNPKLQGSYEDDHPAVLWAVENVIKACNKAKVHSLIKGRILTANPKIVRKFVKWGVTSVVVSPDEQEQIRESIADAEGSLFSKRKR
jgi:pyruvate,water dikinase